MEVITMESAAYQDLVAKIEKIAEYVFRKGNNNTPDVEEDIWLDSQEVADMLHISTRTLQRLRTDNLIDYTFERGKCKYRFSEIKKKVNEKIINCEPHLIDEFRKKVLLRGE